MHVSGLRFGRVVEIVNVIRQFPDDEVPNHETEQVMESLAYMLEADPVGESDMPFTHLVFDGFIPLGAVERVKNVNALRGTLFNSDKTELRNRLAQREASLPGPQQAVTNWFNDSISLQSPRQIHQRIPDDLRQEYREKAMPVEVVYSKTSTGLYLRALHYHNKFIRVNADSTWL